VYAIPGIFDADGTETQEFESYAVIAIVPNLTTTETAILVEGRNMQATEAGGEIVTNPERLKLLLHHLGHQEGRPVPPFEALIKLTSVPGGYTDAQAIAFRYPAQPRV
jgi:aspartate ammonia-lyase